MDFQELNDELNRCSEKAQTLSYDLSVHRELFLMAKASYERNFARELLQAKLTHPKMVQSELKAQALELSYEDRLAYIRAESQYFRLRTELQAARDRMEALREVSFNLRRELSLQT